MSRLFGKGRDDGGGGGPRAYHQEAFACIADRRIPELGENEAPLMVRKAWPVGDIGLLMIIIAVAHPQETSCEGEKSANRAIPCLNREDRSLGHIVQIGRASCRERVCQYV